MPNYLAFDTETNGLPLIPDNPDMYDVLNWPRVYQIGAILVDEFGFEEGRMNKIIKPNNWVISTRSKFHAELGITTEYLMDVGVPLAHAMDEFIALAEKADEYVCHNAMFDRPVLTCEMFRVKHFPYHWSTKPQHCTKLMTEPILKLPGYKGKKYKWPTLQEAYAFFNEGRSFEGAHDALADVQATVEVFFQAKQWIDDGMDEFFG